jgi:hypothetical protein
MNFRKKPSYPKTVLRCCFLIKAGETYSSEKTFKGYNTTKENETYCYFQWKLAEQLIFVMVLMQDHERAYFDSTDWVLG